MARKAHVSVATVSRALSSPDLVRPDTRSRVLTAATELGYHPNRAARGLITGKTGNLGIVVPDLDNPFFTGVLKAVQKRAAQSDYAVFVANSDENPTAEAKLVQAMAKQVDGLVLCSPGLTDEQITATAGSTALVLLDHELAGVPSTVMDRRGGTNQVFAHLAALGHRRVAVLNGTGPSVEPLDVVNLGPFAPRYEGGLQAADLALAADVTAIMAHNDVMALGVLARLRDRGVSVPDDVSVTGFDNLTYASLSTPALTTVRMPLSTAGRTAVAMLLERLDFPCGEVPHVVLPTQIIIRGTTAPPPGKR
ncbi:LacI family DNA-binding transcriptional regulator [Umezawaea sp. Da 62-37]|uniref:LacI family DNA-binding transcriptional regulator n=1 Tax=Umezawaea sp. Da 62-37 TaxID=3075927 RepID=UPI0028F72C13|nr:LacI family DNA-binding transcriptional regulator [Umezawaea sp. Da 62-37]WNV89364.1 LacI family DNA-binding transcriptional regulator [Umezawaea sp. Da 62-37]